MADKRKADTTLQEPNAKAAKEETKTEDKVEEETDAKKDTRPTLTENVGFEVNDTTLNVVPTMDGQMLMSLADGGVQYLVAGARANVGIKGGRYMFEVKVVQALSPADSPQGWQRQNAQPGQLVRIGLSTAGSQLVLGETADGICFDSDGQLFADNKKEMGAQRFGRDVVIALVVNVDPKSPNKNTVSLFRDGVRISDPKPLPESLLKKPLFPHVSYRNVTLQVNWGPAPLAALPFKCRMVGNAARDDVVVTPSSKPKDGKYEVIFPVAFPDEGTFDWLDSFLEKNPQYVELSDRRILDWAAKSGMWKTKGNSKGNSNDRPEFNFRIPSMDDFSVRRVINSITSVMPRNYVVMEVKANLCADDRKENLKRFRGPHFKRVAQVVMGEPNSFYKKRVQAKLTAQKQQKADIEFRAQQEAKAHKKAIEKRQKEFIKLQKQREEEQTKVAEEAAKKDTEEKKGGEEKKDVAKEEKKEKEDAEMKDEKSDDDEAAEPPKVELSDEQKKMWFLPPTQVRDVADHIISHSFGQFTVPEKSEGFDELRFEWQNEGKSREYLSKWVLGKKLSTRVEELQPSEWFTTKASEWAKNFADWQKKAADYQEKNKDKPKKEEKLDDDEDMDEKEREKDQDIFSIEDICDVGTGEPLFAYFAYEDWMLLSLRFELYHLMQAFKKDINDPDRPGFVEPHLAFYYQKYYRKGLNPQAFGKGAHAEIIDLVKDTVTIDADSSVLSSPLSDDTAVSMFVKLTEEKRRERQRRIDAGDETGRLKFLTMGPVTTGVFTASSVSMLQAAQQTAAPAAKQWGKGGGGKGKWQKPQYAPRTAGYQKWR